MHTDSVGLPWTTDRHVAETATLQHKTLHERQTSTLPTGFEPAIPASKRLHVYTLNLILCLTSQHFGPRCFSFGSQSNQRLFSDLRKWFHS